MTQQGRCDPLHLLRKLEKDAAEPRHARPADPPHLVKGSDYKDWCRKMDEDLGEWETVFERMCRIRDWYSERDVQEQAEYEDWCYTVDKYVE